MGVRGRGKWVMDTEEGPCWDEHWVLYGNQFDNKFHIKKILEEKAGKNLFDLSHSNFLLDMSPKPREIKAKMNYWDLIKIKTSAQLGKQATKLKGNEWNGRRYLQTTDQIKGYYPKSINILSNSAPKKQIIQ